MRTGLVIACALAALGCGDDPIRIQGGACELGEEQRLAVPEGPIVHDVALASDGERAWAVWSDRSGAYVRELDARGAPRGEALRIGAPCDAGLAAEVRDGAPWIACGRRGEDARRDEGGVQLVAVREGEGGAARVETHGAFGPVGPDGDGVALDLEGSAPRIGWQEARGAVSAAWVAEARDHASPERLSTPRFRASRPALATRADGTPIAAWAETWLAPDGDPEGRIELRIGARAARAVAEVAFELPYPVLRAAPRPGSGAADEPLLAFRDRRPERARARLQVSRLAAGEAAIGPVLGASHANAIGDALAVPCGEEVWVVAPRTHSRTERLIGLRRHSRALEPTGPEQQLYEHGAAFEHADARCVGGRLLVLFAGRATRVHREGTIRAVSLTCP